MPPHAANCPSTRTGTTACADRPSDEGRCHIEPPVVRALELDQCLITILSFFSSSPISSSVSDRVGQGPKSPAVSSRTRLPVRHACCTLAGSSRSALMDRVCGRDRGACCRCACCSGFMIWRVRVLRCPYSVFPLPPDRPGFGVVRIPCHLLPRAFPASALSVFRVASSAGVRHGPIRPLLSLCRSHVANASTAAGLCCRRRRANPFLSRYRTTCGGYYPMSFRPRLRNFKIVSELGVLV